MAEITLKIETGSSGGPPPVRKYRASKHYDLKVSTNTTLKELKDLIVKTAVEARVEQSPVFRDATTLEQAVTQAGLADGSVLQFNNDNKPMELLLGQKTKTTRAMSNVDLDLEEEEVALTGAQSFEDIEIEDNKRPRPTRRRRAGNGIPQKWQNVLTIAGVAVVLTAIVVTLYFSLRSEAPKNPMPVPGTPRRDSYEEPERPILVELFAATGGSNWTRKDNWLTDAPVCEWFGVWCDFGQIRSLSLLQNNLRGTIPASIGNLTTLGQLNFPYNHLEGTIPKELAGLTELKVLILVQNNLTGEPPLEDLASLKLQSIDLGKNRLTGEISSQFINSIELVISLAHNNFYGTIPDVQSDSLNTLFLSDNQFTGTLPRLPSAINRLSLEYNMLTGDTHELLSLTGIQRLNIAGNNFTGQFMLNEEQFGQLEYLNIEDNGFSSVRAVNVTLNPDFECHASNLNLACPLPNWMEQCSATCK